MKRVCEGILGLMVFLLAVSPDCARAADEIESDERAVALRAPRPKYPYEARKARVVGAGVAVMEVDSETGKVTRAFMAESTGAGILDQAAIDAFSRWQFKPGTVSRARVPISFSMGGRVITEYRVKSENMDDVLARFLGKGTVRTGPIPAYPRSPAWTNKSGKGVYELRADKEGKIEEVRILKSSGDATFDRVAVKTLGKWRLRRGPLIVELPLAFTLTPKNYSVQVAR